MINASKGRETKVAEARGTVDQLDEDRCFTSLVSTIANKVSRGGSRLYLQLFGVGIIEWRILQALDEHPGVTAQAICNAVELDKAAASRSIQSLETAGLVASTPDPKDRRKRTLVLTSAGAALHERLSTVSAQRERKLLAGFSPGERETLLRLLRRMHANAVEVDLSDDAGSRREARPGPLRGRAKVVAQVA